MHNSTEEMKQLISSASKDGRPHYVYGLVRADTQQIFYVGKGVRNRFLDHERLEGVNPHKEAVIRKHGVAAYVLFGAYETQEEAYEIEVATMDAIGIGNLTNVCAGGIGGDSEVTKQQWADPDSKIRAAVQSSEHRERQGQKAKEWHSDPARCRAHRDAMANPETREKLREAWERNFANPEYREKIAKANVGRVWSPEAIAARSAGMRKHWESEDARKAHSELMSEVCSTPEMRAVKSRVSREHWESMTEKERQADSEAKKARGAQPEFKAKVSAASKRMWAEASEEKRARMASATREANAKRTEERKRNGTYKGPYVKKYATEEEREAGRSRNLKKFASSPEEKEIRSKRSKKLMRDPEHQRKVAEGRKRQAAIVREQRKAYCAAHGVTAPGKNFCNVDKAHFQKWVADNFTIGD